MTITLRPGTWRILRHEYSQKQWDRLIRRVRRSGCRIAFRGIMFEHEDCLKYAGIAPYTRLWRVPIGRPEVPIIAQKDKGTKNVLYFRSVPIRSDYVARPKLLKV